jgi:hypothetical protein
VERTDLRTVQAASRQEKAIRAQTVTITLEDDLTGGPVQETVRFAVEAPAVRST